MHETGRALRAGMPRRIGATWATPKIKADSAGTASARAAAIEAAAVKETAANEARQPGQNRHACRNALERATYPQISPEFIASIAAFTGAARHLPV